MTSAGVVLLTAIVFFVGITNCAVVTSELGTTVNATEYLDQNSTIEAATTSTTPRPKSQDVGDPDSEIPTGKVFEDAWKRITKAGVKWLMPRLMNFTSNSGNSTLKISGKCVRSLMKYIGGLTSAKLWAVKMFDSTSKPAAGLFEGTFSDFGAFDQCLDITVPLRNGGEEFRGAYCAIEATPNLPPQPKNFTIANSGHAGSMDTISKEITLSGGVFYYLKFRLGVCVPSACTAEDIQNMASQVEKRVRMKIVIPKCYVREDKINLSAIHIVVIIIVLVLIALCVVGSRLDMLAKSSNSDNKSTGIKILLSFSVPRNVNKLFGDTKGAQELKALHGIRGLSIAWVILGHTYVWTNFQLLRRAQTLQDWFQQLDFEAVANAWLSVEPFFILSGLLTCYGCMQLMEKTKGKINIPMFILRRYIRLMPPLLMVMGWLFFLPVISSGPFWYERIDPEINSCTYNWWASVLFISNWMSIKTICIHPTWYMSADFQLHILSLLILFPLYRSGKLGCVVMSILSLASIITIAVITYIMELPPIIQIASANDERITQTADNIHIRTFTHAGPFIVGMAVGYILWKNKDIKLSKLVCITAWCCSFTVCVASLYGVHSWNTHNSHGPLLTCIYASLHRITFSIGVAWVAFACITGHAGPVNTFLSAKVLAPFSRLTFCIYLTQSLVIWTRRASERERMYYNHYNELYEYVGNVLGSVLLAIPLHLLVEAPVSNLDRLIFTRARPKEPTAESKRQPGDDEPDEQPVSNGHSNSVDIIKASNLSLDSAVELKSVKSVDDSDLTNHCSSNG